MSEHESRREQVARIIHAGVTTGYSRWEWLSGEAHTVYLSAADAVLAALDAMPKGDGGTKRLPLTVGVDDSFRTVTSAEELEALDWGARFIDADGVHWVAVQRGYIASDGGDRVRGASKVPLPATILTPATPTPTVSRSAILNAVAGADVSPLHDGSRSLNHGEVVAVAMSVGRMLDANGLLADEPDIPYAANIPTEEGETND
jgi:hypothetical protein